MDKASVVKKLDAEMRKLFAVKNITESSGAFHVMKYLEDMGSRDLVDKLKEVKHRLETMGVTWQSETTAVPFGCGTHEFWLFAYQLSLSMMRGVPKQVNVLETVRIFMDSPFSSQRSPLTVLSPPGGELDLGFHVSLGCTRSLAAKILCLMSLGLTDEELFAVRQEISACIQVKVVMEPPLPVGDQVAHSMRQKFVIAESTRPDILQMYIALDRSFAAQGLRYVSEIKKWIQSFNAKSSVEAAKLSDMECRMLLLLPQQSEAFFHLLEKHWDSFKASESGVTLRTLCSTLDPQLTKSDGAGLWASILQRTAEKNTFWLRREVTIFLHNVQDAVRSTKKGQTFSLRSRSPRLRDASPDQGYTMVGLFVQFRSDLLRMLGTDLYAKEETSFLRGVYDREFADKIRSQDPALSVESFQFASILIGSNTTVRSVAMMEAEANEALEQAQLKAWQTKVLKESTLFDDFVSRRRQHLMTRQADERQHLLEEEQKFQEAAQKYLDEWMPTVFVQKEGYVASQVLHQVADFALKQSVTEDALNSILLLDFTKLGTAFSKHLLVSIQIVADTIAAFPQSSAAVIFAPNTGVWGSTHGEGDAESAIEKVESELKNLKAQLAYRKCSLVMAESSLASQSRRCGHLACCGVSRCLHAELCLIWTCCQT